MKRTILFSLSILSTLLLQAAIGIKNNDGKILYYELNNETKLAKITISEGDPYVGIINIPEQVTHEGMTYDVATISDKAFFDCKDLTEISIPRTITKIGGHAFKGCDHLRTVNYNANNCVSAASITGKSVSSAFEILRRILSTRLLSLRLLQFRLHSPAYSKNVLCADRARR
jgi:hypothetical protein